MSDILVGTMDTMRVTWFIELMNSRDKPVLLVGDTGTAKTAIIQEYLRNLDPESYVRAIKQTTIKFSPLLIVCSVYNISTYKFNDPTTFFT